MSRVRPIALFLGAGLCVLAYLGLTVHRRAPSEFITAPNAIRTGIELANWRAHGYFRSYGLLMPTSDAHALYRSSTGAYRVTGYVVWLVTGGSRYAQALHNQVVSLLTAVLLALLAYRIALRLGIPQRHALALALGVEMVQFTFPDNLALFWDMTAQAYWLPFAIAFFLVRTRWQRMLVVFAMTYVEYVCATMFLVAYALAVFFTSEDRPSWKTLLLPWLAALALFGLQLGLARVDDGVHLIGSSFAYRTGLDGDAELYKTPLDIALGRDIVRAQRPAARAQLFHWPVLFFAGVAAVIASFVRARDSILLLVALIGAYVLYASVFSQAVALHPYLYDALLFAPLVLALFAIAPATFEKGSGIVTLVMFWAAVWTAFFNIRIYAMTYPLR